MKQNPVTLGVRTTLPLLIKVFLIAGVVYLVFRQLYANPLHSVPGLTHSSIQSQPSSSNDKEIPRKIWQTWHTPAGLLADEDKERVRSWLEKNPHYQYELVTDRGSETYVRQHFAEDPMIRDVFLNLTDTIIRADFLRYLVLYADGGVYADLDVECRDSVDNWVPMAFRGKASMVLGVENDRKPVENDVKLYYDHREYIWGITNWTIMSKRGHPFLRFMAHTVANNLIEVARKQERTISTMDLSYKEVIDATGPGAFTKAFFEYISKATGTLITYADVSMLEEPKLIDDILILPIRAFSVGEADRSDVEGAHSDSWPTVVYHWSAGTWKKTHFQKPEVITEN